jgi:hypothetical protein
MILAASLVVRNEAGRYLEACIDHLADFCDLVVVWDDASDDDTLELLAGRHDCLRLHGSIQPGFFIHEGHVRQRLLDATLSWSPTHVLAIDADEFVDDGAGLRRTLEHSTRRIWGLDMEEVWNLDGDELEIREDGGWRTHPVPAVWRVTGDPAGFRMRDRRLACGRVPAQMNKPRAALPAGANILHFGWANPATRQARFNRYAEADRGRFHARRHLDSILWPDEKITLRRRGWPTGLTAYRTRIEQRAGKEPAWQA